VYICRNTILCKYITKHFSVCIISFHFGFIIFIHVFYYKVSYVFNQFSSYNKLMHTFFLYNFPSLAFRRIRVSREKRLLASSCPSVRKYQRGSHWTDFRVGDYYKNLSSKSKFG
jgi:hypothetical protein